MRNTHPERLIFLGLVLLATSVQPRALQKIMRATSLKVSSSQKAQLQSNAVETTRGSIIVAEEQSGLDLGAKIIAADTRLGSAAGEIQVAKSGEISQTVILSQNHDLVCLGGVTITMSNIQAKITQQSNTRVRGCTLSSSQTSAPTGGAEILSQGTTNVQVEDVTFLGGGHHIAYNTVSNFSITKTRHISITVKGASPIVIYSSNHGQIASTRIEGFVMPAGDTGVRLIGINKSSFIHVSDPVIQNVDASTVPGCGGVTFTASSDSSLQGGMITGLKNCDGVLTESTGAAASSDITITGTVSNGHNPSPGAGRNASNGEGFDIFNSQRVRLSDVVARDGGKAQGNHQPGIEVSNSRQISISNSVSSNNGGEGIRVDGSKGVTISGSHINHNGRAGILVMPALGHVSVTARSPAVEWTPGDANMTFSAVWPAGTKIAIDGIVYTIASLQSTTELRLTSGFSAATGKYEYNVDSYVEITGGESLDNGQLSVGLPPNQKVGEREGVYFAGGLSGEVTGGVTRLHASDTQSRKTQTFGIRVENHARIFGNQNSTDGNLAGKIQDSAGKSTIR